MYRLCVWLIWGSDFICHPVLYQDTSVGACPSDSDIQDPGPVLPVGAAGLAEEFQALLQQSELFHMQLSTQNHRPVLCPSRAHCDTNFSGCHDCDFKVKTE